VAEKRWKTGKGGKPTDVFFRGGGGETGLAGIHREGHHSKGGGGEAIGGVRLKRGLIVVTNCDRSQEPNPGKIPTGLGCRQRVEKIALYERGRFVALASEEVGGGGGGGGGGGRGEHLGLLGGEKVKGRTAKEKTLREENPS